MQEQTPQQRSKVETGFTTEQEKTVGMASHEKSKLLNKNKRSEPEPYGVLDPVGDSFVHPRTFEHRCFLAFLAIMIVCLIGLGGMVFYDPPQRDLKEEIIATLTGLDLLNSLYHARRPTLASGCESTLLLIRHCEEHEDGVNPRDGGIKHCSWLGRERSYFLPSLFDPEDPQHRWPVPTVIFALTQERSVGPDNYREIETVMPLAKKFNLTIEVYPTDEKQLATDYFELLQSGNMCGKLAVVCWKHVQIPDVALTLGCGSTEGCPSEYPEDNYDEVWQMKYVFDPAGKARWSRSPLDLPVEIQGPLSIPAAYRAIDNEEEQQTDNTNRNRQLGQQINGKQWIVYGTKSFQYFDPLQFSLESGDYPPGGSLSGGKWDDVPLGPSGREG